MIYGIWGTGREGQATMEWLVKNQPAAQVVMVDESMADPPGMADGRVKVIHGPQALPHLLDADTVIVSPGVPGVHPFRRTLADRAVTVTSGTDLWMATNADHCIGVTGTKGKSTTTSLITALLNQSGEPARLAGNIGIPLLSLPASSDTTVVELSSYQCHSLTRSPSLAVIVNLYQEHLTWHGSLEAYWRDKCRVFTQGAKTLVADQATLETITGLGVNFRDVDAIAVSPDVTDRLDCVIAGLDPSQVPLLFASGPGRHNLALALLAAQAWGVPVSDDSIAQVVSTFQALPHRLNLIATTGRRRWYDDTLSTSAESVIAAGQALAQTPRTFIVGGQSRGISYAGLTEYLLSRPDNLPYVVTMPSNGRDIAAGYEAEQPTMVRHADSLDEAVRIAAILGPADSHVILSPGAPSYDLYANYEAKSAAYIEAIAACAQPLA
ncbi:MAG: UDP-N-acetylmuramoyl-L-alanine--D-glutamate ligase [Propionibacteriaceae bacterium]|jgi:UDP-N-acetylmuramoylalanine--D-glutamate ligase|nr:UDP-N-acetylmuramoyl-L-alanine--D-glutamate ligase [Propionibacteriaceae bacterium]